MIHRKYREALTAESTQNPRSRQGLSSKSLPANTIELQRKGIAFSDERISYGDDVRITTGKSRHDSLSINKNNEEERELTDLL